MKTIKINIIQVLSDGSITFCSDACTNLKQFRIYKKDHKNFFINNKKKSVDIKNFDSLQKHKNKYLY